MRQAGVDRGTDDDSDVEMPDADNADTNEEEEVEEDSDEDSDSSNYSGCFDWDDDCVSSGTEDHDEDAEHPVLDMKIIRAIERHSKGVCAASTSGSYI